MAIQVVILAAGQGKRMYSKIPKVMHKIAGKSLLSHVIDIANIAAPISSSIVIYGHQGDIIRDAFAHYNAKWVEQKEQLGTGHALMQALPLMNDGDKVLVLYGDVPLTSEQTLKKLIETTPDNAIGMLTAHLTKPTGYGRIKRDNNNQVIGIVEEKDATEAERAITEVNSGIYYVPVVLLKKWLPTLENKNAQGEYYLTDIIELAAKEKIQIHTVQPESNQEIFGVNDRLQLAELERFYQMKYTEKLMRHGVTIIDPMRLDIRGNLKVGMDVTIDVNVILEGEVTIGDHCVIGPNTVLKNVTLGDRVEIKANSMIEDAKVAADCVIGPFARIRPGTVLAEHVHVGNFVEIKNSKIGANTKANHLSYIGDSDVGQRVNIGAGTITCNYDGVNKHKTVIGDDVHIGSDTQLVAPVTIGNGATIGAGSTVTKDAPPQQLTLTHKLEQRSMPNWVRPVKKSTQKST